MKRILKKMNVVARAQEGVAYLEFAITLPFLIALFLGAVEMTRYILIVQKVEKVAVTVSDIVAQSSNITTTELNVLIQAAGQVMKPFTFDTNAYVIISSVKKTGTNPPVVNWQYKGGGTWSHSSQVGTPGTSANMPAGFTMVDKDNVIVSEVFYNFTPLLTNVVGNVVGNGEIYKLSIFKPRLGDLSSLGS